MRLRVYVLSAVAVLTVAGTASAAQFVIPEEKPASYSAYESRNIAQPWVGEQPNLRLTERPIGELIAVKLGLANGRAELFSYRLENAPSNSTKLDGVVDGGGVKLKLTW